MCNIHIHILSKHSVLLDILTVINTHYSLYVHILHYVQIHTHSDMPRCNRLYISWKQNVMDVHWNHQIFVFVQCVQVQLNCVKVKVQCMAYRNVGVCCRVYYFWLFISLIAWGKKLSALRSTSVEDEGRRGIVAHSDHLTSACQEVQDPAAQTSV